MTINDYILYWKNLVAQHVHIKQFYRLNHDELDDALTNWVEYPVFVLSDYEGYLRTNEDKTRFFDVQKCSFIILGHINPQDYNDEHQKLNDYKNWGLGLLAYTHLAMSESPNQCPLFPFLIDEASIKYSITDWLQEHNKGVLFEFDLIDHSFRFRHNPSDFI